MAIMVAVAGAGDIVAGGLRQILQTAPDLEVVDLPAHFGIIPDVVIYDAVGLLDNDGTVLDTLLEYHESAVVVVSRDLRPDLAARAMARGADACISIETGGDDVLAVIRAAANGDLGRGPFDSTSPLGHEAQMPPREVAVLSGIVVGLSNQEISEREGLSPNTVKSYIRSAYRRIGVTTRAQAVSWGLQHGFTPHDHIDVAGADPA